MQPSEQEEAEHEVIMINDGKRKPSLKKFGRKDSSKSIGESTNGNTVTTAATREREEEKTSEQAESRFTVGSDRGMSGASIRTKRQK